MPAIKVGMEWLFDIIATADEREGLIVATNLPFECWTEVLGSERLNDLRCARPADTPLSHRRNHGQ